MTGSLQTKKGNYYVVLSYTERGKRKQKWIATGLEIKGNKRKAEQILRDTLQEYETKPVVAKCDILFSEYVKAWLKIAHRRVDDVTLQGYEQVATSQIIPYFEQRRTKLGDITLEVLQNFFDEKYEHGRMKDGGQLSPSTLRRFKNIINQALNEAVKKNLIPSNPCNFVELPKKQHYESKFYDIDQLKQLFEQSAQDPLWQLIQITALYGLRRSEVLGIKWDSIDFIGRRLIIKHTVTRMKSTIEKDKTKNASSHSSFPLTDEAYDIFVAIKKEEAENRDMCGSSYIENDYVFKWPNGKPYSPDYVSEHFATLLKRCGLPHIRFHELRHSCASLLLNNGFTLKDVQEYMRHTDIQMTANIYGHLDSARKQATAANVSLSLFGKNGESVRTPLELDRIKKLN